MYAIYMYAIYIHSHHVAAFYRTYQGYISSYKNSTFIKACFMTSCCNMYKNYIFFLIAYIRRFFLSYQMENCWNYSTVIFMKQAYVNQVKAIIQG